MDGPFLWCIWFSLLASTSADSPSWKNESQLIKDVFRNYDPLVWPNQGNNPNWSISVRMIVNSLVELNEKDQILSISAVFNLQWKEPLLTWNPEEYNSEVLYVPPEMVWKPDIIIQNAVDNYGKIGSENLKMFLNFSGNIQWMPGDFYKVYCKVDVRHYPFDTQTCVVSLEPWSCPQKVINLDLRGDPAVITRNSEENGEWKIVDQFGRKIKMNVGKRYRIDFNFVLRRKTLFYIINMILPIVFLSMLNSLTFALPANSGEKMTLCISVLLSYAVFLTLVNDALPENSDGVCFFSAYLATEIFMSAASTIVTVLVLSYYHQTEKVQVRLWMTWILPKLSKNKLQDEVWAIKNLDADVELKKLELEEVRMVSGAVVAEALDKLFLKIFSIANVLVTMIFFCAMKGM